MNKLVILIIILFSIVGVILFLIMNGEFNEEITSVCFSEKCFEVEVVRTPEERAQGLMFREFLELNKGMLFIFPREEKYSFWMKNTLIPLDIIWISKDLEIVYIEKNVLPCIEEICESYPPNEKALYVLEINSDLSEGIVVGDKVNFP